MILERVRELRRRQRLKDAPLSPSSSDEPQQRIKALETRIEHLESALEALEDATYRQAVSEGKRLDALHKRTQPEQMARALSEDARRRGTS